MKVVVKTDITAYPLLSRGKVRDIYDVDEKTLLIVTTDRMSAFDVIMSEPIPYKGVILNKITLFGAIYLGIIAVVPILISHFSTTADLSGISLGGTSIIIVVGVALETVRALEAQLLMRNYKGFLS